MEKIGISYKLQRSLLKQEMSHDEIYDYTWEVKEREWLPYPKKLSYQPLSPMLDIQKVWKE